MSVLSVLYSNNFNLFTHKHILIYWNKLVLFIFLLMIHGTYYLEVYVVYDASKIYGKICNKYSNRT